MSLPLLGGGHLHLQKKPSVLYKVLLKIKHLKWNICYLPFIDHLKVFHFFFFGIVSSRHCFSLFSFILFSYLFISFLLSSFRFLHLSLLLAFPPTPLLVCCLSLPFRRFKYYSIVISMIIIVYYREWSSSLLISIIIIVEITIEFLCLHVLCVFVCFTVEDNNPLLMMKRIIASVIAAIITIKLVPSPSLLDKIINIFYWMSVAINCKFRLFFLSFCCISVHLFNIFLCLFWFSSLLLVVVVAVLNCFCIAIFQ